MTNNNEAIPERSSVLREADHLINNDRNETYGDPYENHMEIAVIFNSWLRRRYGASTQQLDAEDIAACLIALKLCRQAHCPKRDNFVDLAAYAGIGQEVTRRCTI